MQREFSSQIRETLVTNRETFSHQREFICHTLRSHIHQPHFISRTQQPPSPSGKHSVTNGTLSAVRGIHSASFD